MAKPIIILFKIDFIPLVLENLSVNYSVKIINYYLTNETLPMYSCIVSLKSYNITLYT